MSAGPTRPSAEWNDCLPPGPAIGDPVQTACGGTVQYSLTTPCVWLQGKTIYFCLPICKADCERDPNHCCITLNASGGCR